ncbi:TetR/AcrR family transcriptional regulator [Ligilactobacillus salivarius]|uniref:TetR/AcrR family transcriptional regulator n=1 Tax=Ligilactobacillus salivarius TaxID=1624 RepID=A0ABD6XEV2_9LACO|nr:TetR/AcrR family transcriptional regulator [Ligilactobacillus salivarius]MBN2922318.1 TetR/AcrR family transcriptional regulator [Lactobacillus sp.]ATP36920.1 TetR/AcrR family transcriptional regulator [Ligilactobacillus salivarius]KRM68539.1 hypothetical protein FC55_GL001026 [Ligilactobacillus salivarius DSM 20555 = ATCC 11741]MBE7938533.1 TetR/AcrR family transcriptional regulator [Ligilactobacillus salivarius]MDG9755997.1 TetR/AcrR family transcriptional regulator [Ligilactobacillus sal
MRKLSSIQTIEQLKKGMLDLLVQKEYQEIRITDLTSKVGINRTTFYLFYDSKDALFEDLCASLLVPFYIKYYPITLKQDAQDEQELLTEILLFVEKFQSAFARIFNVHTLHGDGESLLISSLE